MYVRRATLTCSPPSPWSPLMKTVKSVALLTSAALLLGESGPPVAVLEHPVYCPCYSNSKLGSFAMRGDQKSKKSFRKNTST